MNLIASTAWLASTPIPTSIGQSAWDSEYFFVSFMMLVMVGGAGLASFVGLVYIWARAFKRVTASQGLANCGACTYPVRGAATMNCSECGADFRVVGIVSPRMRRAYITPLIFIVLWSLCLWLPASLISAVLIEIGPTSQVWSEDAEVTPIDTKASGYDSISLNRSHIGVFTSWFEDETMIGNNDFLTLDIYGPNDANTWVEIDLTNNTYYDYYGSSNNHHPFDRSTVEAWLVAVGADAKKPEVQKEVDELYACIKQTKAQGLGKMNWTQYSLSHSNRYSEDGPAWWFILLQPVFWVLFYAGGIALYFWLHRRYQQGVAKLNAEHAEAVGDVDPEDAGLPSSPELALSAESASAT